MASRVYRPKHRKASATLLEVATGHFVRDEKSEERACDRMVELTGGAVVRFSQSRATRQTNGIPDRRYRVKGTAFWFEVKAEDGKLSVDQHRFLTSELQCGSLASCGTVVELSAIIGALTVQDVAAAVRLASAQVEDWAARGFR